MTRFQYAWVVVAITFLGLLVTSSVRAAPGVLITPARTATAAAAAYHLQRVGQGVLKRWRS